MRRFGQGRGGTWRGGVAALILALVVAGCGTPGRGATPTDGDPARSVARQDGYTVMLALVPAAETGAGATLGAIDGVGFQLEVAGPVAARIELEVFVFGPDGRVEHGSIDRVAFRREAGDRSDGPIGRLLGPIVLPDGARAGDEVRLLAATETHAGWLGESPRVWLRLEAGPGGALRGVAALPAPKAPSDWARFTPTATPTEPPPAPTPTRPPPPSVIITRPPGTPAPIATPALRPGGTPWRFQPVTPTLWPARGRALGGEEATWRAAALLPPAIYARARVATARGSDGSWVIGFSGLRATAEALRWPDLINPYAMPLPTLTLDTLRVTVDADGWQPRRAEAFADPHAPPETPQPRLARALPEGHAAILLPPGGVRARWAAIGPPTEWVRPLGREELRAAGFTVVATPEEFARAAARARVLWVGRDAVPLVDRAWLRARYDEGIVVGILDGTLVELGDLLGIELNSYGAIQPGVWQPVASSAYEQRCGSGRRGGTTSEWLYLAWIMGVSQKMTGPPCG